jgi:hypothetical protein
MKHLLKKTSILLFCGLLVMNAACTTIKPVYNVNQDSYSSQLKPGDRVRLSYLDGRVREIDVTEVSDTEINGTIHKNTQTEPKGYAVVVDWQDIHAVETVKISAIKTVGAGVGVVVAIPFLVLGAMMGGFGG